MGLKLSGCSGVKIQAYYPFKYAQGSTLYVCKAAREKGVIEKLTIKKVLLHLKGNVPIITYLDTTNEIWMEKELCTHADAVQLATKYLEREIVKLNQKECTQLYTQG